MQTAYRDVEYRKVNVQMLRGRDMETEDGDIESRVKSM